MQVNLIGELKIMKELNIKPNFSSLQRQYNVDRHTIKKYYENDGVPLRKKKKSSSIFDPYYDEIVLLMSKPHVSKKSVFMFLKNKYTDFPGTYNGFKSYAINRNIMLNSINRAHPLYEVDPGYQLQVDWKEDIFIHLKDGTGLNFNVFSATLGYSREHVFIYSSSKTEDDFKRCIIETFRRLGGVTRTVLTDNMSAVVSSHKGKRKVHPGIHQLFKDIGCDLMLCKPRAPETKGKDENSNKFIKWIYPYDYILESEMDVIDVIEKTICSQCNNQINSGTGIPPTVLFEKEKEYLRPLPNRMLLESYLKETFRYTVPPTQLIEYKGHKYSLPPEYIGKRVTVCRIDNYLYIYSNKILAAKHNISQNRINYEYNHYKNGLKQSIRSKEIDIDKAARENLERLRRL